MSDGPAIPDYGMRRAAPLEGFLDQASAIPLEGITDRLEGDDTFSHAVKRDREQVCALAATLLEPGYRPLLDWLCDITLRRPMLLPNLGAEAVAYVALREGQNTIVYQLLRAAAEGRDQRIEPREGC